MSTNDTYNDIANLRLGDDTGYIKDLCLLEQTSRRRTANGPSQACVYSYVTEEPVCILVMHYLDDSLEWAERYIIDYEINTPLSAEESSLILSLPMGTNYEDMPECVHTKDVNFVEQLEDGGWARIPNTFYIVVDGIGLMFTDGRLAQVDQRLTL